MRLGKHQLLGLLNLKLLGLTVAEQLKENPKFWELLRSGPRPLFIRGILWWQLTNRSRLPNLKSLASAITEILKGNPKFQWAFLAQGHVHFLIRFYHGLGIPQLRAKFTDAGFVYYGNMREFVFTIWNKPKWGDPIFSEKLPLPLHSQTHFFPFNV